MFRLFLITLALCHTAFALQYLNTKEEYDALISESGDELLVVEFTSFDCDPCHQLAPKVEEFAERYTDVKFVKVDINRADIDITADANISVLPTFNFYKNGRKMYGYKGADADLLERMIKDFKQ